MNEIKIDTSVSTSLVMFLAEYSKRGPKEDELRVFLEYKLNESDILFSLQQGLVTIDETINFVLEHVFTKFVTNENFYTKEDKKLERINLTLKEFIENNMTT